MKFYKNLNKKFNPLGFIIGFIATILIMLQLTGCGQVADTSGSDDAYIAAANTSVQETSAPVEDTYPDEELDEVTVTDEPVAVTPVPSEETTIEEEPASEDASVADGIAVTGIPSITISDDTLAQAGGYWVFGFRDDAWTGLGKDDATVKPFELYYGLHVSIEDSIVTYRAYSHVDGIEPNRTVVKSLDTGKWSDVPVAKYDTDNSFNLEKQDNGLFTVTVYFDNDAKCSVPLYVNDGQAYAVYTITGTEETARTALEKPDVIRNLAESHNVTPEKSLSVDSEDIAYPVAEWGTDRCDTDLWRELAHEIVPDDSLADSVKVVMLHDWMTENLAYDKYEKMVTKVSRAKYYSDYTGTWSVYDTHAGVCKDFVNIFAIMCRELGIPCGSLDSDSLVHTWSIVYLDGEWWEVDLTGDIRRFVYKEDVTDVSGTQTICYSYFLTLLPTNSIDKVNYMNDSLSCSSYRITGEHNDCIHVN